MVKPKCIDYEMVKDLLDYDCNTGTFTFKEREIKYCKTIAYMNRFNRNMAGNKAGSDKPNGNGNLYTHITLLDSVRFLAHRIAWVWMTGEQPIEIDHINGNGLDNRWCNLRNVTRSENQRNQKLKSNNTSGHVGVSYQRRDSSWNATIGNGGGKRGITKTFKHKKDAINWRKIMSKKLNYTKRHGTVCNGI